MALVNVQTFQNLNTDIQVLNTQIDNISDIIEPIETQITTINTSIDAINANIISIESDITANATNITNNKITVDESISDVQLEVSNITTTLSSLTSTSATLVDAIDALAADQPALSASIISNTDAIVSVSNNLNAKQDVITTSTQLSVNSISIATPQDVRTGDTIFYSSTDNNINKNTGEGIRTSLNACKTDGSNASGAWAINITGSCYSVLQIYTFVGGGQSAAGGAVRLRSGMTGACTCQSFYNNNGTKVGSIIINTSSTSFSTSSDYRLKENVVELTDATERLKKLNPCRFNFIGNEEIVDGFIAHEVQEIVPEAVSGIKDAVDENGNPDYQGIDQSKLIPLLAAAIKDVIRRIEILENV